MSYLRQGASYSFFLPQPPKKETNMKHAYMGYIPSNVRYDKELSCRDKMIYCEITATLDNGYCTKKNYYFSKAFGYSESSISKSITQLRRCGHINVNIEKDELTNKYKKRYIWISTPQYSVVENGDIKNSTSQESVVETGNKRRQVIFNSDQTPIADASPHHVYYYTNNILHTKYNTMAKKIQIKKEITDNQKKFLMKIIEEFYGTQHQRNKMLIPSSWRKDNNLVNDSINTLYNLITIDKYSEIEVRDILRWCVLDKFWSANLNSLRSLRKKSTNGFSKFANLHNTWRSSATSEWRSK